MLIAPRIERANGTAMAKQDVAELLHRGVLPPGPGVDAFESEIIDGYLKRVTAETYLLAERIGLKRARLPGIAFFKGLEHPRKYVYWALKGQQPSDVVKDWRAIIDRAASSKRPLWAVRRQKLFRMTTVTLKQAPKLIGPAANTAGKALLPTP